MCNYGFRVYFVDTCVSIKSIDDLHHKHVTYVYIKINLVENYSPKCRVKQITHKIIFNIHNRNL